MFMSKPKPSMQVLLQTSLLDGGSSAYLEQLYEDYLKNPNSINGEWRAYFDSLPAVKEGSKEIPHSEIQKQFLQISSNTNPSQNQTSSMPVLKPASQTPEVLQNSKQISEALDHERKQTKVHALIDAYRLLGHLHADIDPLHIREEWPVPELMLSYYHFSDKDLNTTFEAGSLPGQPKRTLKDIIEMLKTIYCGTIASEFMHIPDSTERVWVQERVEQMCSDRTVTKEVQKYLMDRLTAAEGLERYLGSKYPGAKRFSLEGTDSLMIALDQFVQASGVKGFKEVMMGMAHRGRLNVLVNLLGKNPIDLFNEFENKKYDIVLESGDVKYHQGFSTDVITPGGHVHLSLAFNPSHLEIVSPVVCGSVRARQERRNDINQTEILCIIMHGDASFAGQGVVMETLNMSKTRGFGIGGSINIIINNQIGFTTSDPKDARSTLYCSDIGKMIEVPIFHVNADDPEAVWCVTNLALEYKMKFKKDVIIDLIGYRRQGHNEADEPAATQPGMYQIIRKMPTVREKYAKQLVKNSVLSEEDIEQYSKEYRDSLDTRRGIVAKNVVEGLTREYANFWKPFFNQDWRIESATSVPKKTILEIAKKLEALPSNLELHPRVKKIIDDRRKMTAEEIPIDWGYGEIMAYATLLYAGYPIRLSGQDTGRGTFFHRHAELHNQNTQFPDYTPLCHISDDQGAFTIIDSLLSEEAVVGFEYGYSTTIPNTLVIWEAQFGDFANNAQVVIDQFISSGEQKWGRLSALTLLLPHGYEGAGPEHSSARLERYLQLSAEHNIQVCVPSTPAQVFHMIRRQLLRPLRKPLIVMTPKSLLRHKLAVSTLQELSEGKFHLILPEVDNIVPEEAKRVVLCSGKIYYELLEKRRLNDRLDVAIIRIEQLYPFPEVELQEILKKYSLAREVIWCQEEPQNQGAWYNSQHHFQSCLLENQVLRYAGRPAAAAPAVGYHHLHEEQQNRLVDEALG